MTSAGSSGGSPPPTTFAQLWSVRSLLGQGQHSLVIEAMPAADGDPSKKYAIKVFEKCDVAVGGGVGSVQQSAETPLGPRPASSSSSKSFAARSAAAAVSPIKPQHRSSLSLSDDATAATTYAAPSVKGHGRVGSAAAPTPLPSFSSSRAKRCHMEYAVLADQYHEQHPFLVSVHSIGVTTNYLYAVLKHYRYGSLYRMLRQGGNNNVTLSEAAARFVIAEVMLGLDFLHYRGVVYRDLKAENVLVDDDGHVVLSDFDLSYSARVRKESIEGGFGEDSGRQDTQHQQQMMMTVSSSANYVQSAFDDRVSSRSDTSSLRSSNTTPLPSSPPSLAGCGSTLSSPQHQRRTSLVGTVDYMSPEVVLDEPVQPAMDVWAVGILAFELVYGYSPFKGTVDRDTLLKIADYARRGGAGPSGLGSAKGGAGGIGFPMALPEEDTSPEFKDFVNKMLRPLPAQRMTLAAAREHPWFRRTLPLAALRPRSAGPASPTAQPIAPCHAEPIVFATVRDRPSPLLATAAARSPSMAPSYSAERSQLLQKLSEQFRSEVVVDDAPSEPRLAFWVPLLPRAQPARRSEQELRALFERGGESSSAAFDRASAASVLHAPEPDQDDQPSFFQRLRRRFQKF